MKVVVIDRQRTARVNRKQLSSLARHFLERPISGSIPPSWDCVSIVLADDALITDVNRTFLGHDYTTDVISFSYPPPPGIAANADGELFINVDQALRLGSRFGGAGRELALYAAHGCDHLGGADDATPAERRRMRRRECRWLQSPVARRLIRGLVVSRGTRKRG